MYQAVTTFTLTEESLDLSVNHRQATYSALDRVRCRSGLFLASAGSFAKISLEASPLVHFASNASKLPRFMAVAQLRGQGDTYFCRDLQFNITIEELMNPFN